MEHGNDVGSVKREEKEKMTRILCKTDSQAKLDCYMVAAKLFCSMEQMTTRVKPVADITDPR